MRFSKRFATPFLLSLVGEVFTLLVGGQGAAAQTIDQFEQVAGVVSERDGHSEVSFSDTALNKRLETEEWSLHFQGTYIEQRKNNFYSAYSSVNSATGNTSLLNRSEGDNNRSFSLSATAYLGVRLWTGAEAYYNPELFEGVPFSAALVGLGGFQNGELQKGSYIPAVTYNARAFVRQTYGLGGGEEYTAPGSVNQLGGYTDRNRVVITWGKLATLDIFDRNEYSHEPRVHFMNFSVFSMAAYGYGADSRGFTYGFVGEWYQNDWVIRGARLAAPTSPNILELDYTLTKDYVDQVEVTHKHLLGANPGALRAIVFSQHAYMSRYQDAILYSQQNGGTPSIFNNRKPNNMYGYGLSAEQALDSDTGFFTRWSWNNDQTETNTLDVARSFSIGTTMKGNRWSRASDTYGIAWAINAISNSEIQYLQMGGQTMFIGDGRIQYKPEQVIETYYSALLAKELFLTTDFQKITNPAYNSSRGPVNIISMRLHYEF